MASGTTPLTRRLQLPAPSALNTAYTEILRQTAAALGGRSVGLWEIADSGVPQRLAAFVPVGRSGTPPRGVAIALNELGDRRARAGKWLSCASDEGVVFLAPVRGTVPRPPPSGVERRSPERVTLELAALCIGLASGSSDLDQYVDQAPVAIKWLDADGMILRANPAELAMLGYAGAEYIGRRVVEFHVDPEVAGEMMRQLAGGTILRDFEVRLRAADGSVRHVVMNAEPHRGADGTLSIHCMSTDITDRKRSELELLHGALHDALTGLSNRPFMLERIGEALERSRRQADYHFALLFLDVDRFKVINDSLGHVAGDRMLVEIARRLENCTRPGDVVARLGGDEFTILVENVRTPADARRVSERVQQEFTEPFIIDGRSVNATASIGIARSVSGYTLPQDMLRDADLAMYRAKAGGRARSELFDIAMREEAQHRMRLETDLRTAVRENQFELRYQPIVDLSTARIDGFEALVRWRHPVRGLLTPDKFIRPAEDTGVIVGLGRWAMREACRQLREWQRAFPNSRPLRMSVNVSASQLAQLDFVSEVRAMLRVLDIDPSTLCLEITEHAVMADVDKMSAVLAELHALRVRLYVDDFGTGYSSLSYLPRFPIQGVKIDRAFVQRIGMRKSDQEVVRAIVVLAQNLGLATIAEGVESGDQRARLLRLGCTQGQGFHFGEPLEASRIEQLLSSRLLTSMTA
jgi:diguanylate cyclase (GGDEF)-like protein/PAS domain S-box-containing protein